VGLYTHDLKRVIAFSTCRQLGYMMLACGLEQYNVALFHLITHVFFKALLFLAAGSIIHSVFDEQDTCTLGGLLKFLPLTYICFLIGSLKLTGIPFYIFAFCSDEILDPQIEHLVWFLNLPVFQKEFEAILVVSVIFILVFSVFFYPKGSKFTIKNKGGMEKFFSILPGFFINYYGAHM
jgi:NADH:ubiquinone oxidoreductase subunit 5 (subunit L)/multisubunit Na+/H+ antiporter MnhA subunit